MTFIPMASLILGLLVPSGPVTSSASVGGPVLRALPESHPAYIRTAVAMGPAEAVGGMHAEPLLRDRAPNVRRDESAKSMSSTKPRVSSGPSSGKKSQVTRVARAARKLQVGLASYYGGFFHGRKTASGEIFDQGLLTAAHRELPFGTLVRVTNLRNGRSVVVRITDRGPYVGQRVIDLSKGAAQKLKFLEAGVVPARLEILPS